MIRYFYLFGYCVFVFLAHLLMPFHRKVRAGIIGRYRSLIRLKSLKIPKDRKVFWLHVASSGEFEQLLPILERLKEKDPALFAYVTYYSPSGERSVQLETNRRKKAQKKIPWDYADYSPFDFRFLVRKVLKALHPTAFIAIHREIWPSILMECKESRVPCFLFSAYFPASANKTFWKYEGWLKYFKVIGTVDEESCTFLKRQVPELNAKKIGDSRIERVVARRNFQSGLPSYASFFENQKVLVMGSVWPKDFEVLMEVVAFHKDKRFIFVPHEPKEEFSNHMIEVLKKQGLKARLWSRWLLEPDSTSQLIYDRVGGLFELYSIAHVAFVGGSFVKRVHNVLEPAAYGLPILTGPLIENSREAQELMRAEGLFRCEDGASISMHLKELEDATKYAHTKKQVESFIQAGLGASQKYVELLT